MTTPTGRAGELLAVLQSEPYRTFSARELAERLHVSTRSVRNYVSQVNETQQDLITTSHSGYRLSNPATTSSGRALAGAAGSPEARRIALLRRLLVAPEGVDLYEAADDLFVSDSTIENDLTRLRQLIRRYDLEITRVGPRLQVTGSETRRRRVMRYLFTTASAQGHQFVDVDELASLSDEPELPAFHRRASAVLAKHHLTINQRTADELTAHVAVLVERVRSGHPVGAEATAPASTLEPLVQDMAGLIEDLFDLTLSRAEKDYLRFLLLEKSVPDDPTALESDEVRAFVDEAYIEFVKDIVGRMRENYMVDLFDERFVSFLALHIKNLVRRASHSEVAIAPVGQSVKNTHPLVHELAVFVAHEIEHGMRITVAEDEIAFLAFHVGGRLQAMHAHDATVRITLIAPKYYDLDASTRSAIEHAVSGLATVEHVITDGEAFGPDLDCDVIATTVPLVSAPDLPIVLVSPLPSTEELDGLRSVVTEVAAGRRHFRAAAWLSTVLDPRLFVTNGEASSSTQVIRRLSELLVRAGCVSPDFADQVLERERLSSTAFAGSSRTRVWVGPARLPRGRRHVVERGRQVLPPPPRGHR